MGDFKAKVSEKQQGDHIVEKFCFENRNNRENRLVEFPEAKGFYIANTMFKKTSHKCTWRGPLILRKRLITYSLIKPKSYKIAVLN